MVAEGDRTVCGRPALAVVGQAALLSLGHLPDPLGAGCSALTRSALLFLVKPSRFNYARPTSVEEVIGLLAAHGDDAKVLAGGQSLMPLMNARLARPELVVDINAVAGLADIEVNGALRIGSVVRQRTIERSADAARIAPIIAAGLRYVGHVGIRSRGTVGGSIAHADPAAELPAIALALDARMAVTGPGGQRTVAAEDFFEGLFATAISADELLTAVEVPRPPAAARSGFVEIARRHGDFALAGVAVSFEYVDGAVRSARIACSGVADRPLLATAAQDFLQQEDANDPRTFAEAGRRAAAQFDPPSDIHAPGSYRKQVIAVLVERALKAAIEGSDGADEARR
jgi:aerobic carbon-monoxide dehydrogenase medium subunit